MADRTHVAVTSRRWARRPICMSRAAMSHHFRKLHGRRVTVHRRGERDAIVNAFWRTILRTRNDALVRGGLADCRPILPMACTSIPTPNSTTFETRAFNRFAFWWTDQRRSIQAGLESDRRNRSLIGRSRAHAATRICMAHFSLRAKATRAGNWPIAPTMFPTPTSCRSLLRIVAAG